MSVGRCGDREQVEIKYKMTRFMEYVIMSTDVSYIMEHPAVFPAS